MEIKTDQFYKNSSSAVQNERLQDALTKATDKFIRTRKEAFVEFGEGEELKQKAREIKEKTLERLDEYLIRLERVVVERGGNVFWAQDAEEAQKYILDLAITKGVKSVVKGKSMVTEEIGLNEALEENGIEPVETDLGEYIVQLAGEKHSHIIAPAIHKSKDDVSKLFSERLQIERFEEVEKLTNVARRILRDKFCNADMGVTGANFAIAETGTIVLVENEGNIRLSTSLPLIHVAVMGIEKVIPTFEDLAVFLKILPRNATGQKMSSYVSLITGPRGRLDTDGPEEFHLVLLDNGRSRILKDKAMREALYCLRCGACLNVCPVYQKIGGHAYGWVYSGPIGSIITPQLVGLGQAKDLPYASSLCAACRDVCPVKIDIPSILLKLRGRISEGGRDDKRGSPVLERMLIKGWYMLMNNVLLYKLSSRLGYYFQKLFVRNGKIKSMPFILSRWTESRDFPLLAKKNFRNVWKEKYGK